MIKISPNMRFSQNISRGSVSAKIKKADDLNCKVFQRMLQLYNKKNAYGLIAVQNNYNLVLPERKNVEMLPIKVKETDDLSAFTSIQEKRENFLSGYSIELPVAKKKKLNILDLSCLMHESTHVLDYLLNPKYIANYKKMCERNIYNKNYFDLYEKYFYNPDDMRKNDTKQMLAIAEEETRKGLRRVPQKDKLIFLNYIKYSMEMEFHAYNQDFKYAKILYKLGKPVNQADLQNFNDFMAFPEKIKLINKLIREELEKVKSKMTINP